MNDTDKQTEIIKTVAISVVVSVISGVLVKLILDKLKSKT